MQSSENMPWKSDGARHAHVDCHWPVPSVIPAASKAPTLATSALDNLLATFKNLLVKIIEQAYTPCSVPTGERLRQIDVCRNARNSRTKAENDPGNDEHGDILRCCLQDDSDQRQK